MKTLFVFVLGLVLGAAGLYYYQHRPVSSTQPGTGSSTVPASARDAADRAAAKTRAAASDLSDTFNQKLQDWHLTSADIHADLAKGGEVARQNAARARERVSDVRIIAMIKAKYVLDSDLSANAITVDCTGGNVTLAGTVESEALIGRAVALALDTGGVQHVVSRLKAGS